MSTQMIDSHCHLQHSQYDPDREEIIRKTLAAGYGMVCVGNDWQTSKQAIELAEKYDGIWATIGSHPTEDDSHPIEDFKKLIISSKKNIAVGEVGLDYYRTPEPEKRTEQKEMFLRHLKLAQEFNLPTIIHCREAHEDMLLILKSYFLNHKSFANGVIHSFTGAWLEAKQFIDLGFYIGLNGIITFSKDYHEMVSQIPLDHILLETDAPYLAPPPFRGKRNEPLYVKYVAEKIAEIKNVSLAEVTEATTINAGKLFKLK